jgi:hypothetical protein
MVAKFLYTFAMNILKMTQVYVYICRGFNTRGIHIYHVYLLVVIKFIHITFVGNILQKVPQK